MYRVWELGEEEKGKRIVSDWDGDTTSYIVYESEEEYKQDKIRRDKIDAECEKAKAAYMYSV